MVRTRRIRLVTRVIDLLVLVAVTLMLSAWAANAIAAVESATLRSVRTDTATPDVTP
ncbi:MAG TPA: hypothetical protein VG408_04365 [Actinomycetota bacterium]|nr:hypothetical protein [Actinomycetota bacterium]